jgi:hypothetical protein
MTMWGVGDIAVAKRDKHHDCGVMGRMYRVSEVYPEDDGSTSLDVGTTTRVFADPLIGWQDGAVLWDSRNFEKLVKSDEDIFKMADAPVKEDA